MILSPKLRFVLGVLRHPSQAWHRLREISRIAAAPPVDKTISSQHLVDVEVIPVNAADSLGERLVEIYARNPSPFVSGPTSTEQLSRRIEKGICHFLVVNSQGEFVGARAFDPEKKLFFNTVTDFPFRGKGYQLSAGVKLRKLLAEEGCREFRCNVMRGNTRIQRALVAAGWDLEPHPDDPDLIRGRIRVDDE